MPSPEPNSCDKPVPSRQHILAKCGKPGWAEQHHRKDTSTISEIHLSRPAHNIPARPDPSAAHRAPKTTLSHLPRVLAVTSEVLASHWHWAAVSGHDDSADSP